MRVACSGAVAPHTDNLRVDGRAHAVVHFAVDLGQRITCTRVAFKWIKSGYSQSRRGGRTD